MSTAHRGKNLLDMTPAQNQDFHSSVTDDGLSHIVIPRMSPLDRLIRRVKPRVPETFTVDLDEFGSFVWSHLDGKRTVYDIGALLSAEFGETIEPVWDRLATFLKMLKNNKLIYYK
ncbi:MAG: PqqD family protein [Clostridiales Family XIII bacterium]|jgi:hypothetical protein|nr:PqqD family protein [Clostridiales Family XIII bacterium]